MPSRTRDVSPGPELRKVKTSAGELLEVPADWELLAPGDAALTRRVKQAGPTWSVSEKRGRKLFSRGVWAPADRIATLRAELELERAKPQYAARLEAGHDRRAREQDRYADEFESTIVEFLAFAPRHAALANQLAAAIAAHAVPVGSGTVARTKRIPIEQRAEAATIAWLRHQTTGYDSMTIPRVKGMRREVRRMLAERSRVLLARYRRGETIDPRECPIARALASKPSARGEADELDELDDDDDDDDDDAFPFTE
ncbi:DUF2293 domain-containing protein [Nannocystaceae bacterium ST9]